MAFVLSSSFFTRVLMIIFIIRGVMAGVDTSKHFYPENFTFDCDNYYVSESLQKRSCVLDRNLIKHYKCSKGTVFAFIRNRNHDDIELCDCLSYQNTGDCEKVTLKEHRKLHCEVKGNIIIFTCYFNTSTKFLGQQIDCMAECHTTINGKNYTYFVTNSTCPLYAGVPTLEPPTTTAAPTTAAPPEKEFPIWAAVVIALGIGGLIALLLFLVWRKRRQAQNLAQDAEGGNTGNPEGEEAEGGDNDAEEEEATNAESAEKSEDAEGGEEAPEEQ